MDALLAGINWIAHWFNGGIYDWSVEFMSWAIQKWTIFRLEFMASMIVFAWDVAKNILNDLNVWTLVVSGWNSLDSDVVNMLAFLRFPDALNILITSVATKFTLRFLPMV